MIYRYLLAVHERRYENPLHTPSYWEEACSWFLRFGPFAGRYWRELTYLQAERMSAWRAAVREMGVEPPLP